MFRKIIKRIQEITVKPLILQYLKKERHFKYEGLKMVALPGVFHPLFFHSTLLLAKYLKNLPLKNKSLLEPGCGAGLISLLAAKAGAEVTTLDLNTRAVENTNLNAIANHLNVRAFKSDLFSNVQQKIFDYIIINPPYYPRKVQNESELAWYCGEDFEYFKRLFGQLPKYYNSQSQVIMILSEDCAIKSIEKIAATFSQELILLESKRVFFEKNYIFRIKQS